MKKLLLSLGFILFACSILSADPISYQLILEVEGGTQALCGYEFHSFGCNNSIGDIHIGTFDIDRSLLSLEGDNLAGIISNFTISIGSVLWDQNRPDPLSEFSGFRGPGGFAPSPGFDIHAGRLTGLEGGVYAFGDFPFIDFYGNSFAAMDIPFTQLLGSLSVRQIPEPSTFLLLTTGLLGLIGNGWRRQFREIRSKFLGLKKI